MPLVDLRDQTTRRTPEELVKHLQTFVLEPKVQRRHLVFLALCLPLPRLLQAYLEH